MTCPAVVNEPYRSRYQALNDRLSSASLARKRSVEDIESLVDDHQSSVSQELLRKYTTNGNITVPSLPPMDTSSSTSVVCSRRYFPAGAQPFITAAFQNVTDIRKSNNASVEMAIANFFHCENISDQIVESPRFARLIKLARTVGDDFKLPSRKKIVGELLDLNYDVVYKQNKEDLCKEAQTFGLAFLGDGATIKRMPLLNILGMCGNTLPTTVAVVDCTVHMQDGGKKDASYIAGLFEETVREYDPGNILTDVFFLTEHQMSRRQGKC